MTNECRYFTYCSLNRSHLLWKTGTCGKLDLEPTGEPCDLHPETQDSRISQQCNFINIKKRQTGSVADTEHTGGYLDRQESDVSKLLVETSNLVIMKPCLVLSGCLRTTFSSLVVLSASGCSFGEKFYFVCNLSWNFLLAGRGLPQTTGLPGSCRPCQCPRCRRAPAGPERAVLDTHPSLLGTRWCTALQLHHWKEEKRELV